MENASKEGRFSAIPNGATSWEARSKLIAAICYIFGVISLETPSMLLLTYILVVIFFLFIRISFSLLLKRYLIITPFLLLMTVPLLWQYSTDHALFALAIIIKAFTSMTVITIVLETQSLDDLMNSLVGLKMPPVLVTILILSYRYVFLFLDDIDKMLTAAKSRFFSGGLRIASLKIYGHLIASLLTKAIQRSDKMYEAMASRGFTGKLTFQNVQKIGHLDLIKTSCTIILILCFIVVEKSILN
ncbi:hypothetical protein GMD78_09085 [Ornithinibacillus sp. L9]|uniref:Cobalt ECF transporter T component CbiQ n=1 Tax=Ornithinibacillus caprae TaxID=2678566 RepID=A0A6N8FFU9_9BACI|nr:energy-coupling factor transporter transmembrane component T [Ornithinibacillus caprae]MUK88542.1 hypothetical protein [Ornithinibacillus caprae]